MPHPIKKKSSKKQVRKKQPVAPQAQPKTRTLAQTKYKSFRLAKRLKHPGPTPTGSFKLTGRALAHVWRHKKLFSYIALVYLILNVMLVRGYLFTSDIGEIKTAISELFTGSLGQAAGSLTVIGLLFGSLNPASAVASLYQAILVLLFSLFIIWTLRQTYLGQPPSLRDVFYKSSYPLVQFVIVIFIIGLQLLPLVLASFIYNAVIVSGIANSFAEILAVGTLAFLFVLWSLYMVTVSIFALYIVTLPDMTPIAALRSAKGLVQHRRWTVMRRVLFLPVALFVLGFFVMIPIIWIASGIAEPIFLFFSALMLPLMHSYMYSLYRELLA